MRRRLVADAACVAVPAAILAGCGGSGGSSAPTSGRRRPCRRAPPSTSMATVKPTGQAQTDAKAALSKILNTPDPGGKIVSLIEGQSKADGHPFNYQQDVAPWLGEKAGFFFTDSRPDGAEGRRRDRDDEPRGVARLRPQGLGRDRDQSGSADLQRRQLPDRPSRPDERSSARSATSWSTGDRRPASRPRSTPRRAIRSATTATSRTRSTSCPSDRLGTFYTVPKTLIDALGSAQFDQQSRARSRRAPASRSTSRSSGALTASAEQLRSRVRRRRQRRRDAGELADRQTSRRSPGSRSVSATSATPRSGPSSSSRTQASRTSSRRSRRWSGDRRLGRPAHQRPRRRGALRARARPSRP